MFDANRWPLALTCCKQTRQHATQKPNPLPRPPPGKCLAPPARRKASYSPIDLDIVLKLPFQYPIPERDKIHRDNQGAPQQLYIDRSLRSFVVMEKELAVYEALRHHHPPHPQHRAEIRDQPSRPRLPVPRTTAAAAGKRGRTPTRRTASAGRGTSSPPSADWTASASRTATWVCPQPRRRWLSADVSKSSTSALRWLRDHYDFAADVERDRFDLSTSLCLILTGIDPFSEARSAREVAEVKRQLGEGRRLLGAGAELLGDGVEDGWTGRGKGTAFGDLATRVDQVLGLASESDLLADLSDDRYQSLELRCVKWLDCVTRNPEWMDGEQYCLACKAQGYEVDLDDWR